MSKHIQTPIPAPWTLRGEGIILLFRFKKSWVDQAANLPEYLQQKFRGGFGYVMLVDYQESPVGPYKELLFIPGKFGEEKLQSITTIFVDSEASTLNGRANWAIPKQTADFHWQKEKGLDRVDVTLNGKPVFQASIRSGGISFPMSTGLLPIRLRQELEDQVLFTQPEGKGWGKLARIQEVEVDPQLFPDIRGIKPLLALKVSPFTLTFPKPSIPA
jgi:Acetoacetate decarboxylase (ADC)